jgi:hypothetical protein
MLHAVKINVVRDSEHYVCMCILNFLMHEVVNYVAQHISFLKSIC